MIEYSTVIIGGGAAGLMCAAHLQSNSGKVLVIEKMEKPSRKVRITGKGRCNLTNVCSNEEFLKKVRNGSDFFSNSLKNFSTEECTKYFQSIGTPLTIERGGRVFPSSMRAGDIADSLERAAHKAGAEIICNSKVVEITKSETNFIITYLQADKEIFISTKTVVITTGGVSYPSTGSTGDGYRFAYNLGHNIEPLRPALVALKIKCDHLTSLDRLVLKNVRLRLLINNSEAGNEFGELEFFTYGIGGAIAIRLSRQAVDAVIDKKDVKLLLDLKPALSKEKLLGRIERELIEEPNMSLLSLLRKLMPYEMTKVVIDTLPYPSNHKISNLSPVQRGEIIDKIKNIEFKVVSYEGFDKAIITAGGVDLSQIESLTMESKLVDGLYFAGEIVDIDADTGGYNLQIAFSTAVTAALDINNKPR
ncbi:MAG: NAD(P)/FAD-dependent oxidoreductase [Rikenellaceae bacterium]